MKLYVLGSGNAFSRKRNNTSFVLEAGKKYLIDCPKDVFKTLDKVSVDIEDVNDVILTHCHPDHLGDIGNLILYKYYMDEIKPNLLTSKEVFDDFERFLSAYDRFFTSDYKSVKLETKEFINFIKLSPDSSNEYDGLKIEIRENIHPIPTLGIRITTQSGERFSYSGDTKYDTELINKLYKRGDLTEKQKNDLLEFLWGADFIVHEADSEENIHTNVKELEKLPENIKKKIYLTHVPDEIRTDFPVLEEYEVYDIRKE